MKWIFSRIIRKIFFKKSLHQNIRYFNVTKKNKLGFDVIWTLSRLIRREKYSGIISYLDTPNFYATIAKKLSGLNVQHIKSERSKTYFDKKLFILKIKKITNRFANVIVCNSHHE